MDIEKKRNQESITVEAAMEHLEEVLHFVRRKLKKTEGRMQDRLVVEIIVEELFTNIASYAYGENTGRVTVECRISQEASEVMVVFTDRGMPYNPLEHEDPDTRASIEEREIGGCGILMAKKMMDDVQYEFRDGKNILTIRKYME